MVPGHLNRLIEAFPRPDEKDHFGDGGEELYLQSLSRSSPRVSVTTFSRPLNHITDLYVIQTLSG